MLKLRPPRFPLGLLSGGLWKGGSVVVSLNVATASDTLDPAITFSTMVLNRFIVSVFFYYLILLKMRDGSNLAAFR